MGLIDADKKLVIHAPVSWCNTVRKEGGRDRGRERGKERGRKGGRERERERETERESTCMHIIMLFDTYAGGCFGRTGELQQRSSEHPWTVHSIRPLSAQTSSGPTRCLSIARASSSSGPMPALTR